MLLQNALLLQRMWTRRAHWRPLRLLLLLLRFSFPARSQFGVHLSVTLLFVWARKLASTSVTREWFLTCVSAHMGCEMVWAREGTHTDATLERFLTCVDSDMSRELIGAGETSITPLHWASVWSLMNWRFTRSVWVASWFHRNETQRSCLRWKKNTFLVRFYESWVSCSLMNCIYIYCIYCLWTYIELFL